MDNAKEDSYYLNKIINDIKFIITKTQCVSFEEFNSNELLNNTVCFKLIQISENAKWLSVDFIKNNPNLPYQQIKGLRNKIVHDYGKIDLTIIYLTIKNDLPILLNCLIQTKTTRP